MTCLGVDLLEFILFEALCDSYNWICVFFFRFRKFSTIILSNTFSNFSLSSPSGIPRTWMSVHLILSQRSLKLFFLFSFSSWCSIGCSPLFYFPDHLCVLLWCWEGLGAGGEGDDRGWDGWMASLTRWTWVWVNSGSWWWTGRPGVLRFMGSQRVGHNWVTQLNWTDII